MTSLAPFARRILLLLTSFVSCRLGFSAAASEPARRRSSSRPGSVCRRLVGPAGPKSSSRRRDDARSSGCPKKPAEKSTFVCPDAEAQQACKSYQELLKAKDTGLPSDAYVCFRKKTDEFFVVHVLQPVFPKHWDEESKQMVTDESPLRGFGYAQTYKDGVLDPKTMPALAFSGQWQPESLFSKSSVFTADTIYLTKLDKNPQRGRFGRRDPGQRRV
jgi:hypothetical protein